MTTLVKIHRKSQMTLPSRLRSAVGVAKGDLVEASVHRGKMVPTPRVVMDRSKFPNVADEYTPAQRRIIDRGIAQSMNEYKRGRSYGPFATHGDFLASLHKEAKKLRGKKK